MSELAAHLVDRVIPHVPLPAVVEHLCRYLLRPPLALERLAESSNGQLRYELVHPRRDGSTHLLLDPMELIEIGHGHAAQDQLVQYTTLGGRADWLRC